jgi:hypothetical protein
MSICVMFSLISNNLFKSFNPIEKDGMQVFQGQLVPNLVNSGHNFFNRLKYSILDCLVQYPKALKVAHT